LLAEVYIRMTRGQKSLVIDGAELAGSDLGYVAVDFSLLALPVIEATVDELDAHLGILAELDKASGGRTIWQAVPA
jgi:DNA polymerase-3 subunit epsilon